MFTAAVLAAALSATPAAPLDTAACEAIPGARDEGPRFEDPDGVFSLNLPSSWVQREMSTLGVAQTDAESHGARAVFDLRQGDVHRQLIARAVTPSGTRERDAAEGRPFGVGKAFTHAGAPCLWVASQGSGHAKIQSMVCDLLVRGAQARFVIDLSYLDTDTCDHGIELRSIVDTLKWGAGVTPGAQ